MLPLVCGYVGTMGVFQEARAFIHDSLFSYLPRPCDVGYVPLTRLTVVFFFLHFFNLRRQVVCARIWLYTSDPAESAGHERPVACKSPYDTRKGVKF